MSSITRRRRSKGPETRTAVEDAIIGAMGRLSAGGHSFTAVSVEELAAEAGIARSTFYLHFHDKSELVRRLMKRVTHELLDATNVWFESEHPENPSRLEQSLRGIAHVYLKYQAIMQAITETAAYDEDVASMFRETMSNLSTNTRAVVKRGQKEGWVRLDVTPEVADALTWMVERCCLQLLTTQKATQRERMIGALTHVVSRSLFAAT
ncbi:MAG: TetR/AcrR family transcriptional regulator [Sinimarinibacterium sp.]|jgi:AcrR family transcriptional regulator